MNDENAVVIDADLNPIFLITDGIAGISDDKTSTRVWIRNCSPYDITIPKDTVLGSWKYLNQALSEVNQLYGVDEKTIFEQIDGVVEMCTDIKGYKRDKLKSLLSEFFALFTGKPSAKQDSSKFKNLFFPLNLQPNAVPAVDRIRTQSPDLEKAKTEHVRDLYKRDLIERCFGPWRAAIHLVKKKDGKWRFTIDYRKLNAQTIPDAFPLPDIDRMFDSL